MNAPTWLRAVTGELLGSALLVLVMFGSGAVRMQLGAATMPSAMLGSIALGLGYGLVIWSFGGLSGAQTNPLTTLIAAAMGGLRWPSVLARILSQLCGTFAAAFFASRLTLLSAAGTSDLYGGRAIAEAVASFGFVLVAMGVAHRRDVRVPVAIGAFVTASFWMTGRATVGNPLLELAIFIAHGEHELAQLMSALGFAAVGASLAAIIAQFLFPHSREAARCLLFTPKELAR